MNLNKKRKYKELFTDLLYSLMFSIAAIVEILKYQGTKPLAFKEFFPIVCLLIGAFIFLTEAEYKHKKLKQ